MSMDREFIRPMLEQPVGRFMLGYAAVSVILGYVILMRIAKVDV
jgi:Flp pilus assembly protein TadB